MAAKSKTDLEKTIEIAIQKALGDTLPAKDAKVQKGVKRAAKDINKRFSKVVKKLEDLKKKQDKKKAGTKAKPAKAGVKAKPAAKAPRAAKRGTVKASTKAKGKK